MATRGNIGVMNEDGSITAIYVHWDSYPEYVGELLLNHYDNVSIINELMDLGNLSRLAENLNPTESHTFDKPQNNVCVAYGRDRGEKKQSASVFKDLAKFEDMADNTGADYQYLYIEGVWSYRSTYKGDWKKLTAEVCVGNETD